jgi:threonine aldolase
MIELRSDTFTLPTPQMLRAIASAPLGNDGYGEDPTVNRLERMAADRLGKEASCLMPSGTMANLASLLAHCRHREGAVLMGDGSDLYVYEQEGASLCRGLAYEPVPTQPDGTLRIADLKAALDRAGGVKSHPVAAICLENPHNLCGGIVLPQAYINEVAGFAHRHGVQFHLDGARLFNAAVASRINPAEIVRYADSVQFCLSKGLAAPAGSMVAGSAEFIERVRSFRKILGGAMRQSGIFAAAGIVSLESMVERLSEDHANASRLGQGLARIPGIELDPGAVQTNIVVFKVTDERFSCFSFIASARERGINLCEFKFGRIRAAVHHGITAEQIDQALEILGELMAEGPVQNAVYCAQAHG